MDAAVQAFINLRDQRSAAKAKVMDAMGRAKLADSRGEDSSALWDVVERYGAKNGIEGELTKQMQEAADAYVAANPQFFATVSHFATEEAKAKVFAGVDNDGNQILVDGQDALVRLIDVLRNQGDVEGAERLTMFELAKFARKDIGTVQSFTLRTGGSR